MGNVLLQNVDLEVVIVTEKNGKQATESDLTGLAVSQVGKGGLPPLWSFADASHLNRGAGASHPPNLRDWVSCRSYPGMTGRYKCFVG